MPDRFLDFVRWCEGLVHFQRADSLSRGLERFSNFMQALFSEASFALDCKDISTSPTQPSEQFQPLLTGHAQPSLTIPDLAFRPADLPRQIAHTLDQTILQ